MTLLDERESDREGKTTRMELSGGQEGVKGSGWGAEGASNPL